MYAEHNSRVCAGYNWKGDSKPGIEPAYKSDVHTVHCTLNGMGQDQYELDWGEQHATTAIWITEGKSKVSGEVTS